MPFYETFCHFIPVTWNSLTSHVPNVTDTNTLHTGWAQKTELFLRVDNFATASGRKACDMSTVFKFCLEKSVKVACR